MPRIFGVQSENYSPLYCAYKGGWETTVSFHNKETIAEGIAFAAPLRGEDVLRAVRGCKGAVTAVSEKEIWRAFGKLALLGFYVEPTSTAAFGGLNKLLRQGLINPEAKTVVLISGSGLKAIDKIMHLRAHPPV